MHNAVEICYAPPPHKKPKSSSERMLSPRPLEADTPAGQAIMCSADIALEGLETTFPDHNGVCIFLICSRQASNSNSSAG